MKQTLILLCGAGWLLSGTAAGHEVALERGVAVPMRDGTVLRADIYRPKAEGKFPALLTRTPYDKGGGVSLALKAAARGYVAIVQDVRGRHESEGQWYPFLHESQDGYDTVEWAAALPYVNGKVAMYGASYVGATQLLAAVAQPPHLAGLFPVVTASDYHEGWTYQGGAFEQWFNESWTSLLAQDTLARRVAQGTNALRHIGRLPLSAYPVLPAVEGRTEDLAPYFSDWLLHPGYDDYWRRWSIEEQHPRVLVPACHVGGWYDIFLGGTLRNYAGLKARGGEAARRGQRLIIGPWAHSMYSGKIGDVDFGPGAKKELSEAIFAFYDDVLRGAGGGRRERPVQIFVMGENVWRDEEDWPLSRARETRYHLHGRGRARGLLGDGLLDEAAPQAGPADRYVYDPADPVPTRGGGLCCDQDRLPAGAFDQRANEGRADVLVYSTPPLKQDLEVTGPVHVELYVSSSAVDTDFTAKLVDVWPSGFAQNLTDGIVRGRYRRGRDRAELMNPGEVYLVTIDLWATSNVFLRGHRLRLEVSSSNFPRFDRNLNTGEDGQNATRMVKAENAIYHDRAHPSALVVPVVPRQGKSGR